MKSANAISTHLLQSEFSNWSSTFETNVTAQYFTSAAFLPLLSLANENTKRYTSSIVNIASISGVMKGSSGGQFAYAASKAAFLHLTRMLATTLTETKIRVNCIAPGLFPSEMTTGMSDDAQKSEIDKKLSNPAGRPGNDADMAACILYLVGPGGLFLNSQVIYPDGGMVLVQPAAV
jgi:NAD(P)-dependent dehydrogenase (short-subunit alcohol dehydrogenase family)